MSIAAPTAPPARADRPAVPVRAERTSRWFALDACKAIALFGMVAHHLADWTGGHVRERWIGFEGFVVTDLAAAIFAVTLGAGAHLVGTRLADRGRSWPEVIGVARRWGVIWLVAMAIDIVNGSWVDGGGVLYTLAVLGLVATFAVAAGARSAWGWWGIALGLAAVAGPVLHGAPPAEGVLDRLWTGTFPVTTYGAFVAVGAALVASAGRGGEAALPLLRAAVAVLAVAQLVAWLVPATAPDGLWPPMRYPGDLAFTAWGTSATLVLWAALRALAPHLHRLAGPLARAGRRTLWVFGLHFALRYLLQRNGLLGTLDTWHWGLVAWATAAGICALACAERPQWVRRRVSSPT